uniref:Trehalose-6-phosphate synthase n=1 Tax=Arundo donax TaxID=35708 RepID=A0A0A9FPL9_ARUDO
MRSMRVGEPAPPPSLVKGEEIGIAASALVRWLLLLLLHWPPAASELMRRRDSPAARRRPGPGPYPRVASPIDRPFVFLLVLGSRALVA